MLFDTSLPNTQHYNVGIKGKVKELHPPQHLSVVANKKGAFRLPSTMVANFTYY